MLSIGNKKYRNLQEQVGYNTECIQELAKAIDGITLEDKLVIIANDSGTFTDEEMTVLNGPLAFISDGSKVWLKQSETVSEFVFKAIDIVATEQGGTYYNVGGSKIVVTRATRAYVTSNDVVITTYNRTQMDALLSAKASLSGANFTGPITASSITENMVGYSFEILTGSMPANLTYNVVYAGAVKNGNKITLVFFAEFTRTGVLSPTYIDYALRFILPSDVMSKIYPYSLSGFNNIVDNKKVAMFSSYSSSVDKPILLLKDGNKLYLNIYGLDTLTENTQYNFRYEVTFLLSDNLAQ